MYSYIEPIQIHITIAYKRWSNKNQKKKKKKKRNIKNWKQLRKPEKLKGQNREE